MAELKIGIWGFGKEGKANYSYAKKTYPDADITILDDGSISAPTNTEHLQGEAAKAAIESGTYDLIIKSPGISLYKNEAQQALKNGTKITSATNIWLAQNSDAKTLIVTGTKGKSTTSSLIAHLLKSMNKDVLLAGNIGTVLLEHKAAQDLNILELSSYQIADLQHAPNYALLLNLFPEHLGWHETHENYFKDKLRLLSLSDETQNILFSENKNINDRYKHKGTDILFNTNDIEHYTSPLKGTHNQINIAAALKTIETLGYNKEEAIKHLHSYKPLPHRQEHIPSRDGITYINDSISTIPEATLEALKIHQDLNITLLLGGEERGQNYEELYRYIMRNKNINLILLPDNGQRIAREISKQNISNQIIQISDFKEAVKHAQKTTPTGGVILLSPAAPSYGHFINFEDRGNQFRDLIEN